MKTKKAVKKQQLKQVVPFTLGDYTTKPGKNFYLPTNKRRKTLTEGEDAKLVFEFHFGEDSGWGDVFVERMFVKVKAGIDGLYIGELANQPLCGAIPLGAPVVFKWSNVIGVA